MKRGMSHFRPSIVFIEPTALCNISCVGCRNTEKLMYGGQTGYLPIEVARKVIPDIRRDTLMVCLYWMGEPLLHREITQIVRELTDNRLGTMIATNGLRLTPEISRQLVDAKLDVLKIAISGMDQEVYGQYHRRGDIDKVLANIGFLMDYIRETRSPMFVIVDFFEFPHNADQVEKAENHFGPMPLHFNVRDAHETMDGKTEDDRITGYAEPSTRPCQWLWTVATVNWQGLLYPCCHVGAVQKGLMMGDLNKNAFGAICNGNGYKRMRKLHLTDQRAKIPACKECYYENIDFQ